MKYPVTLSYIHNGLVRASFMESLLNFLADHEIENINPAQGLYIAQNRNETSKRFVASGSEYWWIIDTDIKFEPGDLGKLLELARPDNIVSALYFARMAGNLVPVWLRYNGSQYELQGKLALASDPIELDAIGMGFCVIGRQVVEALGSKAFDHFYLNGELVGEDVAFCHRAKERGFKIIGDPNTVVTHEKVLGLVK